MGKRTKMNEESIFKAPTAVLDTHIQFGHYQMASDLCETIERLILDVNIAKLLTKN